MIYSVRRFSDDENKKGSGLGKLALGAATLAGGLYAGKKGLFGAGIQKSINKGWANVGKTIGSDSMMLSGAQGVGEANAKMLAKRKAANNIKWSDEARQKYANESGSIYLNDLLGVKNKGAQKYKEAVLRDRAAQGTVTTTPTT